MLGMYYQYMVNIDNFRQPYLRDNAITSITYYNQQSYWLNLLNQERFDELRKSLTITREMQKAPIQDCINEKVCRDVIVPLLEGEDSELKKLLQ